jgi:hypothetical protein
MDKLFLFRGDYLQRESNVDLHIDTLTGKLSLFDISPSLTIQSLLAGGPSETISMNHTHLTSRPSHAHGFKNATTLHPNHYTSQLVYADRWARIFFVQGGAIVQTRQLISRPNICLTFVKQQLKIPYVIQHVKLDDWHSFTSLQHSALNC